MATEFDLAAYAARHTGIARVVRLQYAATHTGGDAKLEAAALRLLMDALKETLAVEQYRAAASRLATLGGPRCVAPEALSCARARTRITRDCAHASGRAHYGCHHVGARTHPVARAAGRRPAVVLRPARSASHLRPDPTRSG